MKDKEQDRHHQQTDADGRGLAKGNAGKNDCHESGIDNGGQIVKDAATCVADVVTNVDDVG